KGRWKNRRLGARLVVVGDKINRVLFHVAHERGAEMGHARFGVTHGSGRIAFHRSKIALPVDQPLAHRPRLRHMHERGVDHGFTVRVIVTAGVAADLCAFTVLPSWEKRQVVHRKQNSPLRWLESVACIWQCARNDDRHRVIEKGPRYFLGYIYGLYFFVWLQHLFGTLALCRTALASAHFR